MLITPTSLEGVLVVTTRRFGDARGWFQETWNRAALIDAGIDANWVQDNHSFSASKGTVRGLHYQAPPHAQAKLVRCTRGAILDVAVDFRRSSPGFGRWVGVELSAELGNQLFIPKGFLHGFLTLTDDVEVQYKCDDYYAPQSDGAVLWNDPDLGIEWNFPALGLSREPILSDKDRAAPTFSAAPRPFN